MRKIAKECFFEEKRNMALGIKEVIEGYVGNCVTKSKTSVSKILVKAIFAGMFIGMGAAGSSVAAHSVGDVGLARLTAAVVFPVGLMMVILLGAELFTGDCLAAMALPEKKISWKAFAKLLISVYIGNFIGAVALAFLVCNSGQLDYTGGLLGAYTIKVATGKVALPFGRALVSGILCNVLVCGAVLMAGCAKDISGKLLCSFFVIMLFVTSGYEHCVANMYYISAGLIAAANPEYVRIAVEQLGVAPEKLELLNMSGFVIKNLIPVTIGNILGGSVLLGLPLFYLNRTKAQNTNRSKEEGYAYDSNDYRRSTGIAS